MKKKKEYFLNFSKKDSRSLELVLPYDKSSTNKFFILLDHVATHFNSKPNLAVVKQPTLLAWAAARNTA